jgi:hypothetical protein
MLVELEVRAQGDPSSFYTSIRPASSEPALIPSDVRTGRRPDRCLSGRCRVDISVTKAGRPHGLPRGAVRRELMWLFGREGRMGTARTNKIPMGNGPSRCCELNDGFMLWVRGVPQAKTRSHDAAQAHRRQLVLLSLRPLIPETNASVECIEQTCMTRLATRIIKDLTTGSQAQAVSIRSYSRFCTFINMNSFTFSALIAPNPCGESQTQRHV